MTRRRIELLGYTMEVPDDMTNEEVLDLVAKQLDMPERGPAPALSLRFRGYSRYDGDVPVEWQISDERPSAHGQLFTGYPAFGFMSLVERAALRALAERAIALVDEADRAGEAA